MRKFLNRSGFAWVLQILLVMYLIQIANELTGGALRVFGIYPREPSSLLFIFTAPFVHGSWLHLINNSIGLLILSGFCLVRGKRFYWRCSLLIIVLGGLLVWIFGRPAVHIGASGWIFGLWSLSIALAWFEKSVINILIALTVILLYGGMVLGVLPSQPGVSFEGHAFGALSGVIAAATYGRRHRRWKMR